VVSEGAWREACVCKAVCVGSRGAQPAAAQERLTAGAGRVESRRARSLTCSVRSPATADKREGGESGTERAPASAPAFIAVFLFALSGGRVPTAFFARIRWTAGAEIHLDAHIHRDRTLRLSFGG